MRRLLPFISVLALGACDRDGLSSSGNDGGPVGRLDSGFGADASILTDASAVPDGALTDADVSFPDIGPEDTGVVDPPCGCPAVFPTCGAPALQPSFTPPETDMVEQMFSHIACADTSIRAALYRLSWECVVDAFEAKLASDADVVVELIVDDRECPSVNGVRQCPLARIESNPRVQIIDDQRSRFMHHKFIIVDDVSVWAGSANMTTRSFCTDYNNAIILEEPAIVGAYVGEFERMFVDGEFGPAVPRGAVSEGVATVYFSPETPSASPPEWFTETIRAIETASTSIDVMTASWTRTEMSDALIAAAGRGVQVRALVLHSYANDAPALALIAAQIPLRKTTVHNKVMIVDGALVTTGSPNWSQNAWQNNEASLFLRDPGIARTYTAEFDRAFLSADLP